MAVHQSDDILLAYGSLMSADSRLRFSGIDCVGIPVMLQGYARGWVTRSIDESQTYVGAWPADDAQLSAQLIPIAFNPALEKREKDYCFERVQPAAVNLISEASQDDFSIQLAQKRLWVCRTLAIQPSDSTYPVNASYVATCLLGCMETLGEEGVQHFFATTRHWPNHIINDLSAPIYPRAAELKSPYLEVISASLFGPTARRGE